LKKSISATVISVRTMVTFLLTRDQGPVYRRKSGEHRVHPATVRRFEKLSDYLRENPQTLRAIWRFMEGR